MPPKRKATAAKAAEAEVIENGAETVEPPKAKRGKAAKSIEKADKIEEPKKTTRSTRAKAAPPIEEKQVTEGEAKKEKKGKKAAAEKDKPSVEKKSPGKKKGVKAKKPKSPVAKVKRNTKAAAKSKSTRGAKKGDDEDEAPTIATSTASQSALVNQVDTDYSNVDFTCDKENRLGKTPNRKISSWNVDGVRAWLKKNGLDYVKREKPDIFCLQETKCSKEKIPVELNNFLDYKSFWCTSDKDGYAGVALFTKIDPLWVEYGLGNEEFDDEGRVITAEYEDFYLVNVYVPNAGRNLVTLPKRLEWNTIFKEFVAKLDAKKPVIVCGDMNVAHTEIDLSNPKTNKRSAGFTEEERDGFSDFLGDQYVDTFRSLYPDKKNAYTFWTYMMKARAKDIGWRLDYFVVSKRFLENICDNEIRKNVFGSDHCPIILNFNI